MKKEHLEADKKIKRESSVRKIILNSIRIILVISLFLAFYNSRRLIFAISLIALIITLIPFLLKKTFGIKLPAEFEIIIIFFIYGLFLLGEVNSFHREFTLLSFVFNFASAIALGFIGLTVMYTLYKGDKIHASPLIIALFSFCFAVAVGTVWEFFEFSVDSLFGFTLQRTTGDTMTGLIANMVGALLVSSAGYVYIKNGNSNLISKLVSRFIERNSRIFGIKTIEDNPGKIISLIEEGEGSKLEFKSTLRTNLHTNQADKQVEHAILKTLAAYLNSDGGTLLIGVSDTGEICGIEKDNFENNDKLNLHFNNIIKDHIGTEYLPFIKSRIINIDGKNILKIDCEKSRKQVFLKNGKEEKFYARNGSSTVELLGSSLIDYINNKFKENN